MPGLSFEKVNVASVTSGEGGKGPSLVSTFCYWGIQPLQEGLEACPSYLHQVPEFDGDLCRRRTPRFIAMDDNTCLFSLGKMIGQSQMELKLEAGATNHCQCLPSSTYLQDSMTSPSWGL